MRSRPATSALEWSGSVARLREPGDTDAERLAAQLPAQPLWTGQRIEKVCAGFWELMPLRASVKITGYLLTDAGGCTDADISDGIRYAVDSGARGINISLGGLDESPFVRDALQYAVSRARLWLRPWATDTNRQRCRVHGGLRARHSWHDVGRGRRQVEAASLLLVDRVAHRDCRARRQRPSTTGARMRDLYGKSRCRPTPIHSSPRGHGLIATWRSDTSERPWRRRCLGSRRVAAQPGGHRD